MREDSASAGEAPEEQAPGDGPERLVEIRCGFAEMAQREAQSAAARVAEARRLYQEQSAALVAAQSEVDPGATQTAKEAARSLFRAAVAAARSRGQVEAAAVAWLAEINRVNAESRSALARVERGHATLNAMRSELGRLTDAAEAAAVMAAAALEACRAARATLAEQVAAQAAARAAAAPSDGAWTPQVAELSARAAALAATAGSPPGPVVPPGEAQPVPATPEGRTVEEERPSPDSLVIDLGSPRPQVIIRLLRRDGRAMSALVEHLAGDDLEARSVWQLNLSSFVDSIIAAAIDDADFEFTPGNPFWDQFSAAESREVARGLAALGYRYDGFEGFVDGRVPVQRDLALALGQAGLLPIKVRHWPSAEESAQLFRGVTVLGDRLIATRAPALTLGELVRLLGRRAEPLADLWNEWPRCRPLLFSTGL
jgi:hypothetical protein